MKLALHRRYPMDDHWEIDPDPLGHIKIEDGKIHLEMDDCPICYQVKKILERPIVYIEDSPDGANRGCAVRMVDKNSEEYVDALIYNLRRLGIEARRIYPAVV